SPGITSSPASTTIRIPSPTGPTGPTTSLASTRPSTARTSAFRAAPTRTPLRSEEHTSALFPYTTLSGSQLSEYHRQLDRPRLRLHWQVPGRLRPGLRLSGRRRQGLHSGPAGAGRGGHAPVSQWRNRDLHLARRPAHGR